MVEVTEFSLTPSIQVRSMFQRTYGEVVTLGPPGEEDRRSFFSDLLLVQAARPPPRLRNTGTVLNVLTKGIHMQTVML